MSTQSLNFKTLTGLLSLLFLFFMGCKNNPTEPSGTLGESQNKIVFVSYHNNYAEIFLINSDGTNLTELTKDTTISNLYPEWSPDGKKIVYVQGHGDAISMMNFDGTNPNRLASVAGDDWDERPIWSPDGKKIVYVPHGTITVMNSDGSNQQPLSSGSSPSWSKDGTKIVFISGYEVFVMNANGSNKQQLTHDSAYTRYPNWSPDGQKIAFLSQRDGNNEIYSINADGTHQLRLTNAPGDDILPYWNPVTAQRLSLFQCAIRVLRFT
jgi:Tol biopolymer transport system component